MRRFFLLQPDVHFLNHGSYGATPRPVFADYQAWQLRVERQPVQFFGRDLAGCAVTIIEYPGAQLETYRAFVCADVSLDPEGDACVPVFRSLGGGAASAVVPPACAE